jgi:hypothetical protein
MPEIDADPPSPFCSPLFFGPGVQESQLLGPDPFLPRARDARERFAKGSSGNPGGRPRGIPNPKRRVPDLVARPLSAEALSDLLDRKPDLLRPPRNCCRRRSLRPTRPSDWASTCRRCARSRMSRRCCCPFWRPLRTARLRPSRERASRGGCVFVCAPSGASLDWRPATEHTLGLAAHVEQCGDFLDARSDDA